MLDTDLDVAIVGGGLVGLSLACALRDSGLRIALVDRTPPPPCLTRDRSGLTRDRLGLTETAAGLPETAADWDVRVYAISPRQRGFLDDCGAWPDSVRMAPVTAMEVFGDDGPSRLRCASGASGVRWRRIVENRLLLAALWQRVRESDVRIVAPAQCRAASFEQDSAQLNLEGRTRCVRGCWWPPMGALSWLRAQAGIEAQVTPYPHTRWWPTLPASARTGGHRAAVVPVRWGAGPAAASGEPLLRWCGLRKRRLPAI